MESTDMNLHILEHLLELMKKKKLENIFVKEIALHANISRQTFYRHFKDKYDVINWFYDENVEALFTHIHSTQAIQQNIAIKCDFYEEHANLFKNAYECSGQNSLRDHEFHRIIDSLTHMVNKKTAHFDKDRLASLHFSIEFYCHGVIGMTINWLNTGCLIQSDIFAHMLIDLMPDDIKTNI